ncbi:MAG: hypothetical protein WBA91_13855 [Paracoccaceae bacterium]
MRQDRMRDLARMAGMVRDADLARLSALSARLTEAERKRSAMIASLSEEAARALSQPDVPLWGALDGHLIFSRQALDRLDYQIEKITRERDRTRTHCARSFGRAEVLGKLSDKSAKKGQQGQ